MSVDVRSLDNSFCGEVRGIDVSAGVSPEDIYAIEHAIAQYPVLCFRNQRITDEQQQGFSSAFGTLMVNEFVEAGGRTDGSKKSIDIGTVNELGAPIDPDSVHARLLAANMQWHTDGSYRRRPNRYTLLSARTLPSTPPDTHYADMYQAWKDLPEARKKELDGLLVEHNMFVSREKTGFLADDFHPQTVALHGEATVHPLVRTNPRSGRKSLYLSSHASHIIGWPKVEGQELLAELCAFATQPERCYAHKWQPYDLVMWDDFATLHRATPYHGIEPRFLSWNGVLAEREPT